MEDRGKSKWPDAAARTVFLSLSFVTALLIWSGLFVPALSNVGPFDESVYLNRGRLLYEEGNLPTVAESPLSALFYAPLVALVSSSPRWLVLSSVLGRLILFTALWAGFLLAARELDPKSRTVLQGAVATLLFVTPILGRLLRNGSDALFATMSCLSLWQLLCFTNRGRWRHLLASSFLVGLSALSRPEGVLFVPALLPVLVVLHRGSGRKIGLALASWILPPAFLLTGFLCLDGISVEENLLGLRKRSYFNFEQGEGLAISDLPPGKVRYLEGQVRARQLYGTGEQNDHSVVTAIRRNPRAYARRLAGAMTRMPLYVVDAYGGYPGLYLFLLAGAGIACLAGERRLLLLGIVLSWPGHLLGNLLFSYRAEHFVLPAVVLVPLAAVGGLHLSTDAWRKKTLWTWLIPLAGAILLSLLLGKPLAFLVFSTFATGLGMTRVLKRLYGQPEAPALGASVLLVTYLVAGMAAEGFDRVRSRDDPPRLSAAMAIREGFAAEARIGTFSPQVVYLAKRRPAEMYLEYRTVATKAELANRLDEEEISGIYVDMDFRQKEPALWSLVESLIGSQLEVVFSSPGGDHLVLRVRRSVGELDR